MKNLKNLLNISYLSIKKIKKKRLTLVNSEETKIIILLK